MKKLVLLPLAALLVVVGCQDLNKNYQIPVEAEVSGPSLSTATAENVYTGRSTICVAYDNQLARLKDRLAANPGDATIEADIADFETLIADNCGSAE